jgi:peptidoglycan/LPS O-acetylase OafA/YrhL
MTLGYREDIDWLRAIAVLSVVAFHFETPGIYGGFVGVDIFFVISGYLITGIIQAEVKEGSFSFARFYERRVRRLLPALYAMVALTAIPSFHYLLSSERAEFFHSVVAVVTFTSNIFFFLQSGYFDHAAVEKPLLHTWSLAVEEQFYLVLPVLVWIVLRWAPRRRIALPLTLAVVTAASFALSIMLMRSDQSAAAFFMSPSRAWEFLAGGLVALPGIPVLRDVRVQPVARAAALVMMAIPILSLRPGPGFPGTNALLPCIGAALFIWSGIGVPTKLRPWYSHHRVVGFFGQISYSLYLWHWPLFAYARFSKASLVLDAADKVALFALTVAISALSWRFIEQPFRSRALVRSRSTAFALAGVSSVALIAASVIGLSLSGGSSEDRVAAQLDAYNAYDYRPVYHSPNCFAPENGVVDESCFRLADGKINVMLWGDSLAAHYVHGLASSIDPQRVNILQATQPACMPTLNALAQGTAACRDFDARMEAHFHDHQPDLVVMSADWLEYARPPRFAGMIADLKATISALNAAAIRVVVLGPSVQFTSRLPSMLLRAHLRGVVPKPDDVVLPDVFALDAMMKDALPAGDRLSYLSVVDAVCPQRQCPVVLESGVPLSWDHAHLTAEGSDYVMQRLMPRLGLSKQFTGIPGREQSERARNP